MPLKNALMFIKLLLFNDLSLSYKHTNYYICASFYVLCSWEGTWVPSPLIVLSCWHVNFTPTDVTCKTKAQADIVLLLDGSWSIGRLNFKTIRTFISRMVEVFDIGPDKVQVGGYHTTAQQCFWVKQWYELFESIVTCTFGGEFQVWLNTVGT